MKSEISESISTSDDDIRPQQVSERMLAAEGELSLVRQMFFNKGYRPDEAKLRQAAHRRLSETLLSASTYYQ